MVLRPDAQELTHACTHNHMNTHTCKANRPRLSEARVRGWCTHWLQAGGLLLLGMASCGVTNGCRVVLTLVTGSGPRVCVQYSKNMLL